MSDADPVDPDDRAHELLDERAVDDEAAVGAGTPAVMPLEAYEADVLEQAAEVPEPDDEP
jgi:hypothetical protein